MEKDKPSRSERRAAERKNTKEKQKHPAGEIYSRRNFLYLSAIAGAGLVLGTCKPWEQEREQEKTGKFDYLLRASVDRPLANKLAEMEDDYTQYDLKDTVARDKHMRLVAKAFANYSNETMTEEELIKSVQWFSREEYDQRFPDSKGSRANTSNNSGVINISEEHPSNSKAVIGEWRKTIPYYSVLSAARASYVHEWFHRSGVTNQRNISEQIFPVKKYYNQDGKLEAVNGFVYIIRDSVTGSLNSDPIIEEAYAYYMTERFEEKLMGKFVPLRPNPSSNTSAKSIDLGVSRMRLLFAQKPSWEDAYQRFHRESDPLGLANFLGKLNPSIRAEDATLYGLDVIMSSVVNDPGADSFFKSYLTSVRK